MEFANVRNADMDNYTHLHAVDVDDDDLMRQHLHVHRNAIPSDAVTDDDAVASHFSMSYNHLIFNDNDTIWSNDVTIESSNADVSACIAYEFIIYSLFGGFLCTVGVIGNCLCFGVFWPDRRKSSTLFLVLTLAVVDTAVLVTWTTIPAVVALAKYTRRLANVRSFLPYAQVYTPTARL